MEQEEQLRDSSSENDQSGVANKTANQISDQPKPCKIDFIDVTKVHGNLDVIFEDKGKSESDFVYQHELYKHLSQQRKDEIKQSSKTIGLSQNEGDSLLSEDRTIDFQVIAQKVALEEGNIDLFQKLPSMKFNEMKEIILSKDDNQIKNLIMENDSVCSDEIDEEIDKSMIQEFWEDFDIDNKIKPEKKKFKFLNLDNPNTMTKSDLHASYQEIFEHFDPNKPPILSNYDKLNEKFKLPSRLLLRLEKTEYNKYINILRKVCKALVRKTRTNIIENAQRIIHKHFKQANANFKSEIDSVYQQFSQIQEDYLQKVQELEDMKAKYVKQEMTFIQFISYFQKILSKSDLSDIKEDDQRLSSALHSKSRRLTIIGDFMNNFSCSNNVMLSNPFSFYSFAVKLENQEKERICKNVYIKSLCNKVSDLQKSLNKANDEIENFSKFIRDMHKEDVRKDEAIRELKYQINSLKCDVEAKENDTKVQVDLVTKSFVERIESLSDQFNEYKVIVEEEVKVRDGIIKQTTSKNKELEILVNKLKKVIINCWSCMLSLMYNFISFIIVII